MWKLALALVLLYPPSAALQPEAFLDTVSCSDGLSCRLLEDVLCIAGETVPDPETGPVLVLTEMMMRNTLRCQERRDCIPCVQVTLRLGLQESPAQLDGGASMTSTQLKKHNGKTEEFLRTHVLLSAETYPSSHCAEVEVLIPLGQRDWYNNTLGLLHFDCFPISISGELYVSASTRPPYLSSHVLQLTHFGPDCTWNEAQDAVRLCQIPMMEISVGLEEAVLHVWDVPEGLHFYLWLYLNQTSGLERLSENITLLTVPENVSLPISQVLPCLCLQVWPKVEDYDDSPRTFLCPFTNNAEALSRAWAKSHLKVKAFRGVLSCSFSAPCDLPGELVPCWKGEDFACHSLHPHLRKGLIRIELQEFPGLRPHPNICIQVISKGHTYLESCLQEEIKENCHSLEQDLLFWTILDSQGNLSVHVLEQGTWVHITQSIHIRNGNLKEALQNDLQSGECMLMWQAEDGENGTLWTCSLEKYCRTRWILAWMITLFGLCSILFVLLLKKEALKGWLRLLKEDYSSKGALQGRHVLLLYSPDHVAFERLVGTLAGALSQLQVSVSLELWSRGELASLGPMQWLHAQRHRIMQAGGTVVLLFSPGAVAGCAEWLGWKQADVKPDNTFLASLNCILPDFQNGKTKGRYIVACFEKLLAVNDIPGLFRSVPAYPLPSQLFAFLLALAGPGIDYEQRSSLKRHAVWISKSLERAVQECQQKEARWEFSPLLPLQSADQQIKGDCHPSVAF